MSNYQTILKLQDILLQNKNIIEKYQNSTNLFNQKQFSSQSSDNESLLIETITETSVEQDRQIKKQQSSQAFELDEIMTILFPQTFSSIQQIQNDHKEQLKKALQNDFENILKSGQSIIEIILEMNKLKAEINNHEKNKPFKMQDRIDILYYYMSPLAMKTTKNNQDNINYKMMSPICYQKEIEKLINIFGTQSINFEAVCGTLENFQNKIYNHPRIIHISGHCDYDNYKKPTIFFQTEDGEAKMCNINEIERIIKQCENVQLVVLALCKSEEIGKMVIQNAQHVISINKHTPVNDEASYQFLKIFYQHLLNNRTILQSFYDAVAYVNQIYKNEGNKFIFDPNHRPCHCSIKFPYRIQKGFQDKTFKPIYYKSVPKNPPYFIGRSIVMMQIIKKLQNNQIIVLTGPIGIGKSAIQIAIGNFVIQNQLKMGIIYINAKDISDFESIGLKLKESVNYKNNEDSQSFMNQQNILLLLDNCDQIDKNIEQSNLLIDFLKKCTFQVLLSMKSQDFSYFSGFKNMEIEGLDNNDSLQLLNSMCSDKAQKNFEKQFQIQAIQTNEEIQKMKSNFISKLQGNPLIILLISKLLNNEIVDKIFHQISKADAEIEKIIQLQYEEIPSDQAKELFIILSLLPSGLGMIDLQKICSKLWGNNWTLYFNSLCKLSLINIISNQINKEKQYSLVNLYQEFAFEKYNISLDNYEGILINLYLEKLEQIIRNIQIDPKSQQYGKDEFLAIERNVKYLIQRQGQINVSINTQNNIIVQQMIDQNEDNLTQNQNETMRIDAIQNWEESELLIQNQSINYQIEQNETSIQQCVNDIESLQQDFSDNKKMQDQLEQLQILYFHGLIYCKRYEKAKCLILLIQNKLNQMKSSNLMILLGCIYYQQSQHDASYQQFEQALLIIEKNEILKIAACNLAIGYLKNSAKNLLESVNLYQQLEHKQGLLLAYKGLQKSYEQDNKGQQNSNYEEQIRYLENQLKESIQIQQLYDPIGLMSNLFD